MLCFSSAVEQTISLGGHHGNNVVDMDAEPGERSAGTNDLVMGDVLCSHKLQEWFVAEGPVDTRTCATDRFGTRTRGPTGVASDERNNMDGTSPQDIGDEAEFVDDATDDDEVDPEEQLLLDRKELSELGLELDNPEGFADE